MPCSNRSFIASCAGIKVREMPRGHWKRPSCWSLLCSTPVQVCRYYQLLAAPVLELTAVQHELVHHAITLSSKRDGSGQSCEVYSLC